MEKRSPSNDELATLLNHIGDLLEARKENPFRVQSYRRAASTVRTAQRPVAALAKEQGVEGLRKLQGVGEKLASVIEEYIETGEVKLLETLKKEVSEDEVEEIQENRERRLGEKPVKLPVDLILAVDEEYRTKAAAGTLRRIAPRQHNPEGEAWLPIMSANYEGCKFTVMFSNTATAHELGKTNDWVVVYYRKEGGGEDQCTVVTQQRGPLKGKRVIRGREKECAEYYGRTAGEPRSKG